MDGEPRPSTTPDIGVDQFVDSDVDDLPDAWEVATFGDMTTLSGTVDADGDGLDDVGEYDWETDRLSADTDGDQLSDGYEVAHGTNPIVVDADDMVSDLNGDGLIDVIGLQLGYGFSQSDSDGDGVSNADEAGMCTNPVRSDSDGDGVADDADVFPLDPRMSSLPTDPEDVTGPQITLTAPWYAVEQ
jgi:hypothetical protein